MDDRVITPDKSKSESILLEAERLTSKDRQSVYGHPIEHFTRTAAMVSAAFAHKLREALTAEDWARIMILDKLSRSLGPQYKRDNMVDVAGYANTHEMVVEEKGRRE